jgi:hypothetical protein
VASQSHQAQLIICLDIDEKKVGLEMAFAAACKSSLQGMVSPSSIQGFSIRQSCDDVFQKRIESLVAGALFVVPLELTG